MAYLNAPSMEQWTRLFDITLKINDLKPWTWMNEADFFGLRHPETGELNLVTILGALGEYHSIIIYRGIKGITGFLEIEYARENLKPEQLLEIPQVHVSFEDRAEMEPVDLEIIKKLGIKVRGSKAWPQFRSYRPGYLPWYIETDEAELLIIALEQSARISQRFRADPKIFNLPPEEWLVCVMRSEGGHPVWEDVPMVLPRPEQSGQISIPIASQTLAAVKNLPRSDAALEISLTMIPVSIGKKDVRPKSGYALLMVEGESGIIAGVQVLEVKTTLEDMWGSIPQHILMLFIKSELLPKEIKVNTDLMAGLCELFAEELGIELKENARLKMTESALKSLAAYLH